MRSRTHADFQQADGSARRTDISISPTAHARKHRDGESRPPAPASVQFVLTKDWKPQIFTPLQKKKPHLKPAYLGESGLSFLVLLLDV